MRLAGIRKGGYYPAPVSAICEAATMLVLDDPEKTNLLDPCAGMGEAVADLAEACHIPDANVHVIEIENDRAAACHERLPDSQVLAPASFLGTNISAGSFQLVWCNPPFDVNIGGGRRVEYDFLRHVTPLIQPDGILVFVIPESTAEIPMVCDYLTRAYSHLTVVPYDEEDRHFKELMIFGRKRKSIMAKGEHDFVWRWRSALRQPSDEKYIVPAGAGPRWFRKSELTPDEAELMASRSPLSKHLAEECEVELPSPPMALGRGHVALLLASGHLDGVVRPDGQEPHVVRGTAHKEEYVSEESTTETESGGEVVRTTLSQRIILTVRVVDAAGDIKTLKQE